jgi:polyisoprenyl-teichoic acid--peptidoglycan teichoic acid transferase
MMLDQTQPTRPAVADTQPSRLPRLDELQPIPVLRPPSRPRRGRVLLAGAVFLFLLLLAVYFLAPLRTNLLLLGTDIAPQRGALGRTDTIILVTFAPHKPYMGMLSIPRDLWVNVPGVGEQRINTAYFFAEAGQAGSGPRAAMQTVRITFGVPVHHYALIHMDGLPEVIDALGGVTVDLERPAGGLPPGTHRLDGVQALAFVRARAGSDDFFRMANAQLLIQAVMRQAVEPASWPRLPAAALALARTVETDLPVWLWPRLGLTLLRLGPQGIDSRVITRELTFPFQTAGGAQVLAPNWQAINPLLEEMFGR